MIRVTLFSKENCSLCTQVISDLQDLQNKIPHTLIVIDVETDDDLRREYAHRVPVIEVGPYVLEPPINQRTLEVTLGAARDRAKQKENDKKYTQRVERGRKLTTGDRLGYWISRHYLFILNFAIFFYVGLPFLAPVFMQLGYPGLARPIYSIYGAVCHQLSFRSWFLYGEQVAYPRTSANVEGLIPYGDATGLDEGDIRGARSFVGNDEIGYKVAFCERDVSIYAAMLIFGLLFASTKRRLSPLPWYIWFVVGILPIGLDGLSQIISQLPVLSIIPYRESTPFLRVLTGGLFGFTTAWFGFPLIEETMSETRLIVASKMARLKGSEK
jgi:uncharacterized membrane protein